MIAPPRSERPMVGLRQSDDSRGNQRHGRVAEVTEQSFQPAAARNDIGVQEGDETRLARGQAGVTGRGRTSALRMPQHLDVRMCAPEKSSTRIGVDDPSSTMTIRKPRNEATSRRKPDALSRTGITMVTSRCDGPPAGRGWATVASSSVRASSALTASRTLSRPSASMS